ncbi:MAG: DUF648 domain-containing protein [Verrucomicrobiota bacterium]|nr:DUF648 domain-containing protein [Verrucomicrobiota bacterium]
MAKELAMINIGFFTPITYPRGEDLSFKEHLLEDVDDYFYLGGKKAVVIKGFEKDKNQYTIIRTFRHSMIVTALKVTSYLTIVLPVSLLIIKAFLRLKNRFYFEIPEKKIGRTFCITTVNNRGTNTEEMGISINSFDSSALISKSNERKIAEDRHVDIFSLPASGPERKKALELLTPQELFALYQKDPEEHHRILLELDKIIEETI